MVVEPPGNSLDAGCTRRSVWRTSGEAYVYVAEMIIMLLVELYLGIYLHLGIKKKIYFIIYYQVSTLTGTVKDLMTSKNKLTLL